jgi:ferritin-like metal-binding protein YciE
LKDIHRAEKKISRGLPKMAKAAERCDAYLSQMSPHRIQHLRALRDQHVAHPVMQSGSDQQ